MPFPTSIDSPGGTAAQGTSLLTSPDHSLDHRVLGSAVIAIENKLGVNSGSAANNFLLVGVGAGQSTWGGTVNSLVLGTPTIGTPSITGGTIANGTINNPIIGTPAITGGTHNNGVFGTPSILGGTITNTMRFIGSEAYSGTLAGTVTIDLGTAQRHLVTLPNSAGSVKIAITNVTANIPFIIEFLQGTAGNGTIGWFSTIKWPNGLPPALGTAASTKDSFGFISTSTTTFDGYIVGLALA